MAWEVVAHPLLTQVHALVDSGIYGFLWRLDVISDTQPSLLNFLNNFQFV
jgi:hypothetical protein